MNNNSYTNPNKELNFGRYALWAMLGLVVLIMIGFVLSGIFFSHIGTEAAIPVNQFYSYPLTFAPHPIVFLFLPLMFLGGLFFILVLGSLGWLLFSRIRVSNERFNVRRIDPALETLRERYAKGEITKEQFDQVSKDIGQY